MGNLLWMCLVMTPPVSGTYDSHCLNENYFFIVEEIFSFKNFSSNQSDRNKQLRKFLEQETEKLDISSKYPLFKEDIFMLISQPLNPYAICCYNVTSSLYIYRTFILNDVMLNVSFCLDDVLRMFSGMS